MFGAGLREFGNHSRMRKLLSSAVKFTLNTKYYHVQPFSFVSKRLKTTGIKNFWELDIGRARSAPYFWGMDAITIQQTKLTVKIKRNSQKRLLRLNKHQVRDADLLCT
jgi:hypothetical protein